MADFCIRPALEKDHPAIRALIREVQINPIGLNWRHFLVAISPADKLIGCGQIKRHLDGSREVASIAVQENARGQGVARAIIEGLLALETTRPLYLMCRKKLEPLYNKFGFLAISQSDMPVYFKRIKQVEELLNGSALPEERLSVMRLVS